MELRLKTLLAVLIAAALLAASACVPGTPTPIPTNTTPPSLNDPWMSKADPILQILLGHKQESPESWPENLRKALESPVVSLGVEFTHALGVDEFDTIERMGIRFGSKVPYMYSNGHAGYGLTSPWDAVYSLAKLPIVVSMNASYNPWVVPAS